jgi:hypothetical protein
MRAGMRRDLIENYMLRGGVRLWQTAGAPIRRAVTV